MSNDRSILEWHREAAHNISRVFHLGGHIDGLQECPTCQRIAQLIANSSPPEPTEGMDEMDVYDYPRYFKHGEDGNVLLLRSKTDFGIIFHVDGRNTERNLGPVDAEFLKSAARITKIQAEQSIGREIPIITSCIIKTDYRGSAALSNSSRNRRLTKNDPLG